MTRYTKVFQQHVPGEDVRRRQLLNGIAIIEHHRIHLLVGGVFQIQVQWLHPPFDVAMLDDECASVYLELRGTGRFQLFHELVREARCLKH